MCGEKKASIRFRVFPPNLPLLQDDSERPSCPQHPHTVRDLYGIVCALRTAFIVALCVAQPNGGGNLLEWIVCICSVPASLAFRPGTVILFRLGRGNPSQGRRDSIFELVTANPISSCMHSNQIVRYLELNSDIFFFCVEMTDIVVGLHVGLRNSVRGWVTMVVSFPGIRVDSLLKWKRNRGGEIAITTTVIDLDVIYLAGHTLYLRVPGTWSIAYVCIFCHIRAYEDTVNGRLCSL